MQAEKHACDYKELSQKMDGCNGEIDGQARCRQRVDSDSRQDRHYSLSMAGDCVHL